MYRTKSESKKKKKDTGRNIPELNTVKKNIIGLTEKELRHIVSEMGYPEFHGSQIFNWVYNKGITEFNSMTDIPERLRKLMGKKFVINHLTVKKRIVSKTGDTIKYDFLLEDRGEIESVALFDDRNRPTFCISTQFGCPVGCIYCATGKMGLKRNLNPGEIINQVITLQQLEKKPNNIVFMGMGEPLLNFESTVKAIEILIKMNIGHRKITVSTCGVINGIKKLADTGLNPRLAVSIGSTVEKSRKMLIPYAKTHSLEELLKAILYYKNKTKRRVTLEYTIIKHVNDSKKEALSLASFAKKAGAHVNIIRFNPIRGVDLSPPDNSTVNRFKNILASKGIVVTERFRRGNEIKAACGQLITRT